MFILILGLDYTGSIKSLASFEMLETPMSKSIAFRRACKIFTDSLIYGDNSRTI